VKGLSNELRDFATKFFNVDSNFDRYCWADDPQCQNNSRDLRHSIFQYLYPEESGCTRFCDYKDQETVNTINKMFENVIGKLRLKRTRVISQALPSQDDNSTENVRVLMYLPSLTSYFLPPTYLYLPSQNGINGNGGNVLLRSPVDSTETPLAKRLRRCPQDLPIPMYIPAGPPRSRKPEKTSRARSSKVKKTIITAVNKFHRIKTLVEELSSITEEPTLQQLRDFYDQASRVCDDLCVIPTAMSSTVESSSNVVYGRNGQSGFYSQTY
jgi:hypothetical protein